ncbi:hypothetical protein T265_06018 [Opisthorchis viverrini]|uniref:Protein kinase domain-containing protein n=1 Tax=Opisthorchis viverrini TaxID=6198 RepID=A0A074ZIJ4_OPIVI|nr:hypothetical protein T265_06018 [Opisthorchis viverrini]KER26806.1 hypothetical protein T265_06018 [Opisthorchis viverrini]
MRHKRYSSVNIPACESVMRQLDKCVQHHKLRRLRHGLRMPNHRFPKRVLFSIPNSNWRKQRDGQPLTWQRSMKEITKRLGAVGATRFPGWGPRDPHCAWLETLQDIAFNRCQWRFCCQFLSRLPELSNESWLYGTETSVLNTDVMLSMMMLMPECSSEMNLARAKRNILLIKLLKNLRQHTPGFSLVEVPRMDTVPGFPSTAIECAALDRFQLCVKHTYVFCTLQAYGIVWKALNRKTHEIVALKKIFDAFRNQTDAQRTFREIAYLQEFGNHPNIIKLFSVIRANTDKDIYLVFEYMETDLHNVIKRGNLLKDVHRQFIMYQLLKATAYLHSAEVIHRDQKPSNVLLDSDCFVKLCDFGLARSLTGRDGKTNGTSQSCIPAVPALTEYVATRWYRAPEILLACHNYTKGVDMWSLGCILGEMLSGSPLFPGKSTLDQLERIVAGLPKITREDVEQVKRELIVCESTLVKVRTAGTAAAARVPLLFVDLRRVVDFLLLSAACEFVCADCVRFPYMWVRLHVRGHEKSTCAENDMSPRSPSAHTFRTAGALAELTKRSSTTCDKPSERDVDHARSVAIGLPSAGEKKTHGREHNGYVPKKWLRERECEKCNGLKLFIGGTLSELGPMLTHAYEAATCCILRRGCLSLINADPRCLGLMQGCDALHIEGALPRQPLEQLFPSADKNALDLMFRMLRLNPLRRITALEALQHPYLRRFYRPSEILTMSHHVVPPLDDNVQLSIAEYRNLLYKVSNDLDMYRIVENQSTEMIISNKLRVRHQIKNTQVLNATHTVKVDGEEQNSGVPRSPKEKSQKSSPLKTIPNNLMSEQETVLVTRKSSAVGNTADPLESTEPEMSGDIDKCTSRTLRGSTNGLDGNDENQTTSTEIDTTPRTRTESVKRSQLETRHDLPETVQKPEVKPCTHSSAVARHSDAVTRRRGTQIKPSLQSSYSVIQNKLGTVQCRPTVSNNSAGERDADHHRRLSGTYQLSTAFRKRNKTGATGITSE